MQQFESYKLHYATVWKIKDVGLYKIHYATVWKVNVPHSTIQQCGKLMWYPIVDMVFTVWYTTVGNCELTYKILYRLNIHVILSRSEHLINQY